MASVLNTSLRSVNRLNQILVSNSIRCMSDIPGSGAGKGGGSGGSIREAGGAFGKMEAAREEEYFRKKQRDQLEGMKKGLDKEKDRLEKLIKEHELEIKKLQQLQTEKK